MSEETGEIAEAETTAPEENENPLKGTEYGEIELNSGDALDSAFADAVKEIEGVKDEPEVKEDEKPSEDQAKDEEEEEQDKPEDKKEDTEPGKLTAPERWTAEQKELFSKQPEEVQKVWIEQAKNWERGANEKFEEAANLRKEAEAAKQFKDEVEGLLTPAMKQQLAQHGLDTKAGFQQLISYHDQFMNNPVEYIRNAMRMANVDPAIFVAGKQPAQQEGEPEPQQNGLNYDMLAPILTPLIDSVNELRQNQLENAQLEAQRANQTVEEAIVSMQGEKDAEGGLKYPYFERVSDDMADILETGRLAHLEPRQRLESAYEQAVYLNPDVRQEIIDARISAEKKAIQQSSHNERLQKAIPPKPSTTNAAPKKRASLDDIIKDSMSQHGY